MEYKDEADRVLLSRAMSNESGTNISTLLKGVKSEDRVAELMNLWVYKKTSIEGTIHYGWDKATEGCEDYTAEIIYNTETKEVIQC